MVDAELAVAPIRIDEAVSSRLGGDSEDGQQYLKDVKEHDRRTYMQLEIKASLPDLLTISSRLKLKEKLQDIKNAEKENTQDTADGNKLVELAKTISTAISGGAAAKSEHARRLADDDAAARQVRHGVKKYLLKKLNEKLALLGNGTQMILPGPLKLVYPDNEQLDCSTNAFSKKDVPNDDTSEDPKPRASFSICVIVRLKVPQETNKMLEQAKREVEKVLHADTRELLVGGNRADSALRLWQFPSWSDDPEPKCISLQGHDSKVYDCSFAEGDDTKAISCDKDGKIIIWDHIPSAKPMDDTRDAKQESHSVTVQGRRKLQRKLVKVRLSPNGERALSMEQIISKTGVVGEGCLRVWNVSKSKTSDQANQIREYSLPDAVGQPGSVTLDSLADGSSIVLAAGRRVEILHDPSAWFRHDGAPSPEGLWLTVESELASLKHTVPLEKQVGATICNAEDFMAGDDAQLMLARSDGSKFALPMFGRTCAMIQRYKHLLFEPDPRRAMRTLVHKAVSLDGMMCKYDPEEPAAGETSLPLLELLVQLWPGCSLLAGADASIPKRMKPYDLAMARVISKSAFWESALSTGEKPSHAARNMFKQKNGKLVEKVSKGVVCTKQYKDQKCNGHAFWYGEDYGLVSDSKYRKFREEIMLVMRLFIEDDWLPFINRAETATNSGEQSHGVAEVPIKVPRYPVPRIMQALQDHKWIDAPQNRVSAKMLLDLCRAVDNGRDLLRVVMRGERQPDGFVALRQMLSTVSPGMRLNFDETGSTEELYWVQGADDPYPEVAYDEKHSSKVRGMQKFEGDDAMVDEKKHRWWDHLIECRGQAGITGMLATGESQLVEAFLCPIYELAAIYEHPTTDKKTSILHELVELKDPSYAASQAAFATLCPVSPRSVLVASQDLRPRATGHDRPVQVGQVRAGRILTFIHSS
jgi:hypothetical protein